MKLYLFTLIRKNFKFYRFKFITIIIMLSIERRLSHELKNYVFSTEYNDNTIDIGFLHESNYYIFTLDYSYPFRPPLKILRNYISISYTPSHVPIELLVMYKNKFDKCPCCETILCPALWTPGFQLIKVIEEYEKFRKDIIKIHKCRFVDKINIPDDIKYYIKMFL